MFRGRGENEGEKKGAVRGDGEIGGGGVME